MKPTVYGMVHLFWMMHCRRRSITSTFDGYSMGASTQTKYKSLERIPGLAIGGWFDAGDFDIQTGSHCDAVLSLVDAWEKFKLNT